jgi:hypothetical protein
MFPLSDDDDFSNDYDTFFGPLRQRKSGMMCSRGTQSTHTTAEVSVTDEELRSMHESISSDGGDTDGWVTDEAVTYSCSGPRRARDPRRPNGPTGNQKRSRCRSSTPKHGLGLATTNTDCLSDLLGPIHRGQSAPNTNRNEPQLEQTYEEIHMLMKTKSDNTVEPSCNTGKSLTCLFNREHENIKPENFKKHLMKCEQRRKVKGVREKSYERGSVYNGHGPPGDL